VREDAQLLAYFIVRVSLFLYMDLPDLVFRNPSADAKMENEASVATQDRVFPYYAPNSSIKHSKSDSKDHSQEIL
jgi:hypothetical protein